MFCKQASFEPLMMLVYGVFFEVKKDEKDKFGGWAALIYLKGVTL